MTVKELLNHSTVTVTMRYAHSNHETKLRAVGQLKSGDKVVTITPREKGRLSVVTVAWNAMKSGKIKNGGMAEWLKAAVLKTVSGVTRSGVRIPLPPPPQLVVVDVLT